MPPRVVAQIAAGLGTLLLTGVTLADDTPAQKPGWRLTFHDDFDRPQLNDMHWFPAYRSGRKEYFQRIGKPSRWTDHNAHYLVEDGVLKLRIDEKLPFRPNKSTPCVSCIQTSDHRMGATLNEYQILDKFAQKYGWFEIRCRCPRGEGLMSAFWLHQHDPTKQEYTPDGRRKGLKDGVVEIDIFEQQGRHIWDMKSVADLNVHFTKDAHHRPQVDVDLSKDFHVWAMEAGRPDRLVLRRQGAQDLEARPRRRRCSSCSHSSSIPAGSGTSIPSRPTQRDFEVDYVRVYAETSRLTKIAKGLFTMPKRILVLSIAVISSMLVCWANWRLPTCYGQATSPPAPSQTVLGEGFEGAIPDFHKYQASYAADTARAHSGAHSLRVTPAGRGGGGAYFRLDGVVDLKSDYEFSAWVYAGAPDAVRLYISASDGKQRQTKGQAAGGKAGQWVQLVGTLRGKDWQATDRQVMLAMFCTTESGLTTVRKVAARPAHRNLPLLSRTMGRRRTGCYNAVRRARSPAAAAMVDGFGFRCRVRPAGPRARRHVDLAFDCLYPV